MAKPLKCEGMATGCRGSHHSKRCSKAVTSSTVAPKRESMPAYIPAYKIDDWEVFEESYGMHFVLKPKMKPPAIYTLYLPWHMIQASLKRKEKHDGEQSDR